MKILIPAASAVAVLIVFFGLFFFTDLFTSSLGGSGAGLGAGVVIGDQGDNRDGGNRDGVLSGNLGLGNNSDEPPPPPPPQTAPELSGNGGEVRITEAIDIKFTPGESGMWTLRTSDNGNSDPTLMVYDNNGNFVGFDDDSGGDFNALLFLDLEAGRTYTITAGFFFDDGTGSYTLTVSPGAAPAFYQGYLYEGIVTINESTNFEFYPSRSGIWEFETSMNDGADPYLELFGPDGIIAYDDDGGEGLNAFLSVYLEVGILYTLKADYYAPWGVDTYRLTTTFAGDFRASQVGTTPSEAYYKGISISRIFDERRENTLGEAIISNSPYYAYEGMEIYYMPGRVYSIVATDPRLFVVNGVTLDKNRAEIIALLGLPLEYYVYPESPDYPYSADDDEQEMRYHVSSYIRDYVMEFWFYDEYSIPSFIGFRPLVPWD